MAAGRPSRSHRRIDDLINTGGVKVPPVLVERALTALPGVAEACVFGVEDPAWGQAVVAAIVATDPAAPPDESVLRDAVRTEVGRTAVPKLFRFVAQLPLLGPGKIDRAALRRSDAADRGNATNSRA